MLQDKAFFIYLNQKKKKKKSSSLLLLMPDLLWHFPANSSRQLPGQRVFLVTLEKVSPGAQGSPHCAQASCSQAQEGRDADAHGGGGVWARVC